MVITTGVQVEVMVKAIPFTESSLKTFQSGDTENASKFALTSDYHLTDAKCIRGNEEFPLPDGNGNERGHSGYRLCENHTTLKYFKLK